MEDVGNSVILNGWIRKIRDHGHHVFIDIEDHTGWTQVMLEGDSELKSLLRHTTVAIEGSVQARPEGMRNADMPTGDVEVTGTGYIVFARSKPLPIPMEGEAEVYDEQRLRWRTLYLRNRSMQNALRLRSEALFRVREYMRGAGFVEIETPILAKPTPEGARDFLVPSRLHPGSFYATPQSPQQYKQKLMVAMFDRYYQLPKCLRDEDFRADRQPEFTQIDIEMAWVDQDDVLPQMEEMTCHVFKETAGIDLPRPFPRMPYSEAMERFGVDRPDMRFGLELQNVSSVFVDTGFGVIKGTLESGGVVRGFRIPGAIEHFSKKKVKKYEEVVKSNGGQGMLFFKMEAGELQSPIAKFLSDEERSGLVDAFGLVDGDVVLAVAGRFDDTCKYLNALRMEAARKLDLIPPDVWKPVYVTDFPLFEWAEEYERWSSMHHPFTSPGVTDLSRVHELAEAIRNGEGTVADWGRDHDIGKLSSQGYDLVLNGWEIAGGSIRIHDPTVQKDIFTLLGISAEDAQAKFGSLLEAFEYGPPPHGGIAFGFDRMVAMMTGATSLREVIAFPKHTDGRCLMDDSPSEIPQESLDELGIEVKVAKKEE